jgi:DNA-binding HxlR family transcriptional regulator
MTYHQTYAQHCGLAHALELVGEPWALLIVRDLLVQPKTLAEMSQGLPQLPGELLSARIEELEKAQVIRRHDPSASADTSVFELTGYGSELEDIVMGLCLWGLRTMSGQRRGEIVTPDALITGLRVAFRPEAARGVHVSFMLNMGDVATYVRVDDGLAEFGKGPLSDADLVIDAGPPLQLLITGEMSPREALETGGIRLRAADGGPGNPGLLMWFVELFHIPPPPVRSTAAGLVPSMRSASSAPPAIAEHAFRLAQVEAALGEARA